MHIEPQCPAARSRSAQDALAVYADALHAVAADYLVEQYIGLSENQLRIGPHTYDLSQVKRLFVIGAGKASALMVQAVERILGSHLAGGIAVTKYGHGLPATCVTLMEAGHPVPDEASVAAGRAIAQLASQARPDDLVVVLISGGASALMELPAEGVTLDDIQSTTRALLSCGATITELNAVRACMSQIKAGGLARLIAPARCVCLVLSDVLGNPLEAIGSGPCVARSASPASALAVLKKYSIETEWAARLAVAADETDEDVRARSQPPHIIVGDIKTALYAARASAVTRGYRPIIVTGWVQGEAREVGLTLGGAARDLADLKISDGIDCLIFGGETTVTVRGDGLGGRCQEIAAVAIPIVAGCSGVTLLAAGTDGTDGPTDAAGALVDGLTAQRAAAQGLSVPGALARSDTYALLNDLGCLIRTGPTGSNVGDLMIAMLS